MARPCERVHYAPLRPAQEQTRRQPDIPGEVLTAVLGSVRLDAVAIGQPGDRAEGPVGDAGRDVTGAACH